MESVLIKQGCMLQDVQVGDQPKISGGPARGEKNGEKVPRRGHSPVRQRVIATLKMLALLLV